MSDSKDSFIFYRSFYEAMEGLKPAQKLAIYEAITSLALNGEDTEMSGISRNIFSLIRPLIKVNNKRYQNGCKGAAHGVKGGAPKGNQNAKKQPRNNLAGLNENNPETTGNVLCIINYENDIKEKDKKKSENAQRFSPPTETEISEFITLNGYSVDPQTFFNFYQSKNWMVGKNKMKDWHAAVRTWNQKEKSCAKKEKHGHQLPTRVTGCSFANPDPGRTA